MSDHTSSGDGTSSTDFKAGRPPAIKVGGMRIGASRPRQTSQSDDKDKNLNNEETLGNSTINGSKNEISDYDNQVEYYNEQESRTLTNHVAGQMVSGTFVPIQKAFPTEAVKSIHDKHGKHPRNEFHSYSKRDDQRFLNQPRKQ